MSTKKSSKRPKKKANRKLTSVAGASGFVSKISDAITAYRLNHQGKDFISSVVNQIDGSNNPPPTTPNGT